MEEFLVIEKQRILHYNLIFNNLCNQIINTLELHEKLKNNTQTYATITRENALIDLKERAIELLNRLETHNDVTKLLTET